MFCPNCGEKLAEGSKFCGFCGTNLSDFIEKSEHTVVKPVDQERFDEHAGRGTGFVQPKKKGNLKKGIGIAIIAVVVITFAFTIMMLINKDRDVYAYVSDGKYQLITDLSKDRTIEIASSRTDASYSQILSFSPDGKYLYYYTKYDTSSGTGSLCRAEYGKLKDNSSKNDNYIETIATKVRLGFRFLDDGTVIYRNGNDSLFYFDGKNSTQIAKSCSDYYIDGSNRIVYETGDYNNGYVLYGVSLKDLDNKIRLASNYSYIINGEDLDNIFFVKNEGDLGQSLYVVGIERDLQKLGDDAKALCTSSGIEYFTAPNGTTLNLYDYVVDDYESADSKVIEPSLDDYAIPTYGYYNLNSESNPNDYDQIYTSCTQPSAFYTSWYTNRSLEYAAEDGGEHASDYQLFVDKYKALENEEGYIVVTDAIKDDLVSLAATCGQGYDGEWLEFCFYKEQNGVTYNDDAYNAEHKKYEAARERISMRNALRDRENAYPVKTLYCYDHGSLTAISENVLVAESRNARTIVYNTTDLVTDNVDLKNVKSIYDIIILFALDYGEANYIIDSNSITPSQMSESAAQVFAEADSNSYATLSIAGSNVYMMDSVGGLYVAKISGGVVGSFNIISDDVYTAVFDDSVVYYLCDQYTSNDFRFYDLYSFENGKSSCLAHDVMSDNISQYEDGAIIAYTNVDTTYGNDYIRGYELTIFYKDGSKTIIDEDVTRYIRVDKSTVLYICDGDLYLFNGKGKSMVHSDVDNLWSLKEMKATKIFGYDDEDY